MHHTGVKNEVGTLHSTAARSMHHHKNEVGTLHSNAARCMHHTGVNNEVGTLHSNIWQRIAQRSVIVWVYPLYSTLQPRRTSVAWEGGDLFAYIFPTTRNNHTHHPGGGGVALTLHAP